MYALFDLDGTLVNSANGMIRCLRRAFDSVGIPCPTDDELISMLGPPFQTQLPLLGVPEEDVGAVIAAYRNEYSAGGMFECAVYDGIIDVLSTLRADGWGLAVATSKPTPFALEIVKHFALDEYFAFVGGAELSGPTQTKAAVIRNVLSQVKCDADGAIMIGDRKEDLIGAYDCNVPSVGANWGFGEAEEMRQPGVLGIAETPFEALEILRMYRRKKVGD